MKHRAKKARSRPKAIKTISRRAVSMVDNCCKYCRMYLTTGLAEHQLTCRYRRA